MPKRPTIANEAHLDQLRQTWIKATADARVERLELTSIDYNALLPLTSMHIQRELINKWSPRVQELLRHMRKLKLVPGLMVRIKWEDRFGFIDGIQRLNLAFNLLNWSKATLPFVLTIQLPPGRRGQELMAVGFAWENGRLGALKPGNILESLTTYVLDPLIRLRKACPFITCGKSVPVRGTFTTLPLVLRAWQSAQSAQPSNLGVGAVNCALEFSDLETKQLTPFLQACYEEWHAQPQARRLWNAANFGVLCWIYRHYVPKTVSMADFRKGLAVLAASGAYWDNTLRGLRATATDRSQVYTSLLTLFGSVGVKLPCPSWATDETTAMPAARHA